MVKKLSLLFFTIAIATVLNAQGADIKISSQERTTLLESLVLVNGSMMFSQMSPDLTFGGALAKTDLRGDDLSDLGQALYAEPRTLIEDGKKYYLISRKDWTRFKMLIDLAQDLSAYYNGSVSRANALMQKN